MLTQRFPGDTEKTTERLSSDRRSSGRGSNSELYSMILNENACFIVNRILSVVVTYISDLFICYTF
jgi:hypothetical protein